VNRHTDRTRNIFVDATRIAEGLFATHLAVNVFLMGVAYQGGHIPLSTGAIEEAIRLNGVDVERNLAAFLWGRKYYDDAASVERYLAPAAPEDGQAKACPTELSRYQGEAYAREYSDFVARVAARAPDLEAPVARYLFKLMMYKDEYEVARLLTDPEFERRAREMWESVESIGYNLHPPLLRALGFKRKLKLGEWFGLPLRMLARLKFLRGTPLDPFGYAAVRREERELIGWYRRLIEECVEKLTPENLPLAIEIASLPDQIRGYEKIKSDSIARVKAMAASKLAEMPARVLQPQ
jgi:indolepyruvate ferredoxin oxidoreductase